MRNPLAWTGLCVVLGAFAWPWWRPSIGPLLLGIVALSVVMVLARRWSVSVVAALVGSFLIGTASVASLPDAPELSNPSYIQGFIRSASRTSAVVSLPDGADVALWFPDGAPRPGVSLAAWVEPARPFVQMPGSPSGPQDDLRAHVRRYRVRQWCVLGGASSTRVPILDEVEHRGVIWALLTGDASEIAEDTMVLLRETGTAHLVAISGMHVGLVSGGVWWLAWWLCRPLSLLPSPQPARIVPALVSFLAAVLYGNAVGWPVSTERAVWMVSLALFARLMGRTVRLWNFLGAAAWAITLFDPAQVGRVSFQLSFGAIVGILLVSPRFMRLIPPDTPRVLRWVARGLSTTIGAMAGTLPVVAWCFQLVSPLSPLSNLIAGPLVAMVALPLVLIATLLPESMQPTLVWAADCSISWMIAMLTTLACDPWTPAVNGWGALLLALSLWCWRRPVLLVAMMLVALSLRSIPKNTVLVTFLPVGQGDAALVEWPDGRRWLIDGGPPSTRVLQYLRRRGITELDDVFLSHPHPDHMGGLVPVVSQLDVERLWVSRLPESDEVQFLSFIEAAGDAVLSFPGDPLPEGISMLHPRVGWRASGRHRVNEESLVLLLEYESRRILFTGDIQEQAESVLVDVVPMVDVIKVAHHGSRTSSSAALIERLQADWAVVSCGPENVFGHPHPQTLWTLRDSGVLRTDKDGAVEFGLSQKGIQIRAWRSGEGWRWIKNSS